MRLSITLLLFLCLHLTGDCNAVFGSNHNGKTAHLSYTCLNRTKLAGFTGQNQRSFFQQPADLPGENDCLLFEEEDNEEENTRKLKSPAEPVSIFLCELFNLQPGTTLTNPVSFYSQKGHPGDCKYIAHRALRI